MLDKLYDSCRFDWMNRICEQLSIVDFLHAGNESSHQCIITSMQNSHDTLIVLDKHNLSSDWRFTNIAALQQIGATNPTEDQLTRQAHDSTRRQLYSPEAALSACHRFTSAQLTRAVGLRWIVITTLPYSDTTYSNFGVHSNLPTVCAKLCCIQLYLTFCAQSLFAI